MIYKVARATLYTYIYYVHQITRANTPGPVIDIFSVAFYIFDPDLAAVHFTVYFSKGL